MAHPFPDLPYAIDALEPHISRETMEYHYGKHHRAYVDKLDKLAKGTEFEHLALEEIIQNIGIDKAAREDKARRAILDNASQAWNHAFYWRCLTPHAAAFPNDLFARKIGTEFGSLDKLQKQFTETALGFVGAGWVWLYAHRDGSLAICTTSNAETLCASGNVPLLVCDVWEHAYYIDRRNDRAGYLAAFWQLVNWKFAAANLTRVDDRRGESTQDERRVSVVQSASWEKEEARNGIAVAGPRYVRCPSGRFGSSGRMSLNTQSNSPPVSRAALCGSAHKAKEE